MGIGTSGSCSDLDLASLVLRTPAGFSLAPSEEAVAGVEPWSWPRQWCSMLSMEALAHRVPLRCRLFGSVGLFLSLNFTLAPQSYPPVPLIACLWPNWLEPDICLPTYCGFTVKLCDLMVVMISQGDS